MKKSIVFKPYDGIDPWKEASLGDAERGLNGPSEE